jgi:hypothetical protein
MIMKQVILEILMIVQPLCFNHLTTGFKYILSLKWNQTNHMFIQMVTK